MEMSDKLHAQAAVPLRRHYKQSETTPTHSSVRTEGRDYSLQNSFLLERIPVSFKLWQRNAAAVN
jgi:hypothetical protein